MNTQNILPQNGGAPSPAPPFCSVTGRSLDPAPDSLDRRSHLKIPSLRAPLLLGAPRPAIGQRRRR